MSIETNVNKSVIEFAVFFTGTKKRCSKPKNHRISLFENKMIKSINEITPETIKEASRIALDKIKEFARANTSTSNLKIEATRYDIGEYGSCSKSTMLFSDEYCKTFALIGF